MGSELGGGQLQLAANSSLDEMPQLLTNTNTSTNTSGRIENPMESIVNVTREYPFDYAIVMFGYLLPVVLFVTIVTNLLVVAVLYQRHMRTPTNIVLFTMAIVDLATLLSPSPWYLYIYTFGNHNKFLYPPSACYAHHVMTDVVPVFFHTSSIWLALLLASQRYIYVCHPTLARTWCTVPRVKRAILVILLTAFLHQVSRFFDNTFVSVEVQFKEAKHLACKNEIAGWVHSLNVAFYYTTYFTFRILFVFIIPCSALITLNWLLFRALKRAETKRTQLLKTRFKIVGAAEPSQANVNSRHAMMNHSQQHLVSTVATTHDPLGCGAAPTMGCFLGQRALASKLNERAIHDERRKNGEADSSGAEFTEEEEDDDGDDNELINLGETLKSHNSTCRSPRPPEAGVQSHTLANTVASSTSAGSKVAAVPPPTAKQSSNDKNQPDDGMKGRPPQKRLNSEISSSSPATTRTVVGGAISGTGGGGGRSDSRESRSSTSSQRSNTRSTSTSASKTDEFSTCADCAAYEAELRRACRGCSMASESHNATTPGGTDLAGLMLHSCEQHERTSTVHRHRHLLRQQSSQCSSILGCATNTTTNDDDISSCLATQNISNSMFVPITGDAIETSSMRGVEDDDVDDDEDNPELAGDGLDEHCKQNKHRHQNADTETHICRRSGARMTARMMANSRADSHLGQMTKSGSMDSRLVCECPKARAMALRRVRSLGKPRQAVESPPVAKKRLMDGRCKEARLSCSALEDSTKAAHKRQQVTQSRQVSGDSSNELPAAAKRRLQSRLSTEGARNNHRPHTGSADRAVAESELLLNASTPDEVAVLGSSGSLMPTIGCHSSDGNELAMAEQRRFEASETGDLLSRLDLRSAANITGGSFQPATATTTLYSANTSSAGSLLHNQHISCMDSLSRQAPEGAPGQAMQPNEFKDRRSSLLVKSDQQLGASLGGQPSSIQQQQRQRKSPSFASCTTGRGSRATLLGPPAMPVISVSGQNSATPNNIQATVPVSARSMDSNRTTLMLVVVVTVFLFVEVPVALMTIAHVMLNTFDAFKDFEFNPYLDYIKLFTNFMIMISYSVNFTIYCSMSKRFRETFRDLFHCGRAGARKRTKRIFSQSQAAHCTQLNPHHFAASTVVTSAVHNNNNHNNNNNNRPPYSQRPSRQLGDTGLAPSNSRQNLLGSTPRTGDRLGQRSTCEL